jgi:hypothetical protein
LEQPQVSPVPIDEVEKEIVKEESPSPTPSILPIQPELEAIQSNNQVTEPKQPTENAQVAKASQAVHNLLGSQFDPNSFSVSSQSLFDDVIVEQQVVEKVIEVQDNQLRTELNKLKSMLKQRKDHDDDLLNYILDIRSRLTASYDTVLSTTVRMIDRSIIVQRI